MAVVVKTGELDRVPEIVVKEKARFMRPGECRSYMRKTLTREFEGIVAGFVEAAKKGSCPHVKLATELLKPLRKSPTKSKGPVARYCEKLEKEQMEKDRSVKERSEKEQQSV